MDDGGDAVWVAPFLRGDYTGEYGFDNELGCGVLSVCSMWDVGGIHCDGDDTESHILLFYTTFDSYFKRSIIKDGFVI